MTGTVVAVLRGGPSSEHDVSLKSGHAVISALPEDMFTIRDIYIDKNGVWYERGRQTAPERVLSQIDVAFIALHGEYGEDGTLQRMLEMHGIPYTGSDSFSSKIAMHKVLAKERARELGLLTPKYHFVGENDDAEQAAAHIVRTFHQPVIVKPVSLGSSVGISIVGGYAPVLSAIQSLLPHGGVLVEEVIIGKEATAGVVEGLRGEELYQLPPVEIIPPEEAAFFDKESKYNGTSQEIVPGRFSRTELNELMRQAAAMHTALGLRHYSRSDFIVSPKGIYYLETNSLPGLTSESLLPKSLSAVGVSLPDFITHVLTKALSH